MGSDDQGLDLLLGRGAGDDKAQPHGEDDAEGDGRRGQPSGHTNVQVGARQPVLQRPEKKMHDYLQGYRARVDRSRLFGGSRSRIPFPFSFLPLPLLVLDAKAG